MLPGREVELNNSLLGDILDELKKLNAKREDLR
jgi:hypothetical protein